MSYFKFKENDLFVNTIEAYPDVKFYIQNGTIYIDNQAYISGTTGRALNMVGDNINGVPRNYISLYQYNINRNTINLDDDRGRIYPWVVKDSNKTSFKSLTTDQYNTQFDYGGNQITSSYNLSASITRYYIRSSDICTNRLRDARPGPFGGPGPERRNPFYLYALRNVLNHYAYLSPHYAFSYYGGRFLCSDRAYGDEAGCIAAGACSDAAYSDEVSCTDAGETWTPNTWDYQTPEANLIDIPSIFYGNSIKKGSVNLKYYISGSLEAQASDIAYDGALVQVSGTTTGQVVGTVLYNEGFILLTSSVTINSQLIKYEDSTVTTSSWCRFGYGANDGNAIIASAESASFAIEFQGVNHIQTMTMLAEASIGQLNNSNNPTYLKNSEKSLEMISSGTYVYIEDKRILKNIVPADYTDIEPPMQKETYISKIALYDKDKNIIGYAKLATPVRKTEDRQFIFKLKLDI